MPPAWLFAEADGSQELAANNAPRLNQGLQRFGNLSSKAGRRSFSASNDQKFFNMGGHVQLVVENTLWKPGLLLYFGDAE